MNHLFIAPIEQIFLDTYKIIHRLGDFELRNVAWLFAQLLFSDAISWQVLEHIRLTEKDTTSSSRVFLQILFQELSEFMGLDKLNLRLKDP
jgi:pre-mRNA-splicing factor CWC22